MKEREIFTGGKGMNKSFMSMAMLLILTGALCAAAQGPEEIPRKSRRQSRPRRQHHRQRRKRRSPITASRVGSETIAYKATAGTILLKDDGNKPTASVFYVAYTRSDIRNWRPRPLAFLYNGGHGSSSVWIHMGAFGPRRVSTADARPTPPPPYRVEDNPNSLISIADLVFVDPVGTGFSKAVGKAKDKDFWGIDQDVKSLAQFINTYVSRNNRWNSPKFLIGTAPSVTPPSSIIFNPTTAWILMVWS